MVIGRSEERNSFICMEMAERYEEAVVTVVFIEWCFYLCKLHMAVMETLVLTD